MTSITVWRDYTNDILPIPDFNNSIIFTTNSTGLPNEHILTSISNYQIDYLIIHFDQMIEREMKKNPDVIYNSKFQQLLQFMMEFRRVVLESRDNADGMAREPFGTTMQHYHCYWISGRGGGDHHFTKDLSYKLKIAVDNGLINPLIYGNYSDGITMMSLVGPRSRNDIPLIFNSAQTIAYFDQCATDETLNLVKNVIEVSEKYWENYKISKVSVQPDEDILGKLGKLFDQNLAETNNTIINGDYNTNYTIIESKLSDTVTMLDNLIATTNTEVNIIEHATDIDGYYEKLKFTDDDIPDKALQKSNDPVDLVDHDQVKTQLTASINKYSSMSTAGVIASAYNIQSSVQNAKNVGALVSNLWSTLGSTANIINPQQELLDLTMAKIHIDVDGKKVAKYLTDKEMDDLRDTEILKQNNYLDALDTGPTSRLQRYKNNYGADSYQTGGKSIKNDLKYEFQNKSNRISISQSGGRDLNSSDLQTEGNRISDRISEIQNEITAVDKIYQIQEDLYFENENFMSVEGLQQKNQYLIEMMNIILIYQYLIGSKTGTYTNFFDDLQNQMNKFKKNLTDTWDIIQARVTTGTVPDQSILKRLLANAVLTTNEVRSLLRSIGVEIHIKDIDNDAIINHAQTMKILEALRDKYGINNIAMIADDLYKLQTYGSQITKAKIDDPRTAEQLYSDLYNYYSTIKSLHISLMAEYRTLDVSSIDFKRISQFAGDTIKSNITTANTFIKVLISVLQSFGIKTGALENIRKESTLSKRQFTDFETLIKESTYRIRNKNILTSEHDDITRTAIDVIPGPALANPGLDSDYLSTFYQTYVTDYATKLSNASNNVVQYYSVQKDLRYLNERKEILAKSYVEYTTVETAVIDKETRDSKLPNLIITDNPTKNPNVDVSVNFKGFAEEIYKYLEYFSNSELPLFPKLMKRLNLQADLSVLFDRFVVSSIENMNNVLLQYIGFTDDSELVKISGMTHNDQYNFVKNVARNYQKYLKLTGGNNNTIKGIERRINNLPDDQLKNDGKVNNLILLTNYLDENLEKDTSSIKSSTIIDSIEEYLNRIYYLMGHKEGDAWNSTDALIVRNRILNQLNIATDSLFNLYYDKISQLYYLFNSLIIINDPKHPDFINITEDQRAIRSLSTQSRIIVLQPSYEYVIKDTSENLIPKIMDNRSPGCPECFVNKTFLPVASEVKNLHNIMNLSRTTYHPYLLLDAEDENIHSTTANYRQVFYQINNEYNTFSKNAMPLLEMMRQMIDNNQNIKNVSGMSIDLNGYDLIQANNLLYTNSFRYNTSIITAVNDTIAKDPTYLLTNNSIFNLILQKYDTKNLIAYLPIYDKDQIAFSDLKLKYRRNDDDLSYSITITKGAINPINIPSGSNLTSNQLTTIINLVNTGNYLVNFMSDLIKVIDDIKTLNVESILSWNKEITESSMEYELRKSKKMILKNTLNVVERIDRTIRDNNNYFYLNQVLSKANIMNARIIVESANPSDTTFNETVDKLWIFTRKLVNVWYSIFGHMLTSLILNNTINQTIAIINMLDNKMDSNSILELTEFKPYYYDKLLKYYETINTELKVNRNRLITNRNRYPISIRSTSKPNGIANTTRDTVEFDQYYSNINHGSNRVYVILLVTKKDKVEDIIIPLKEVATITNSVVDLTNILDKYLSKEFINDLVNIKPNPIDRNILKDYIKLMIDNFTAEFKADLERIGMQNLYQDSIKLINPLQEDILKWIDSGDEYGITFRISRNNLMDLSNDNPFTRKLLLTKKATMGNYQYYTTSIVDDNISDIPIIFNLVLTDIYRELFSKVLMLDLDTKMKSINNLIISTKIFDFSRYSQAFFSFFVTKKINDLYLSNGYLSNLIKIPSKINNDQIKAVLYGSDVYVKNNTSINEINDVLSSVLKYISIDLSNFFQKEIINYNNLLTMDVNLRASIKQNQQSVQEQIQKIKLMLDIISLVMFNQYYKKYAFINSSDLPIYVAEVVDNFETIWRMIETKLRNIITRNNRHLLTLGQINNYLAFKATIGKTINNNAIVKKFYRKISFGIVEYYYNILDSILKCLESKPFEEMSNIESYLYKYQYIQIKRCFELFRWLNLEFKKNKQQEDLIKKSAIPVLQKKIIIEETGQDVGLVFTEFHGLRKYLDDYSAVVMDKVQLHLRINDFADTSYNNILKMETSSKGADYYDLLKDTNPLTEPVKYQEKFDTNGLMFDNADNDRTLHVNFPLLQKIHNINNPLQPDKRFDIYYQSTWNKMESGAGIEFERIYNSSTFPDSDVISNYMSIAPNINNNKGTVIMTYGYSGVGKTASLFGREGTNGILQATFDQFTLSNAAGKAGVEIYFRVYEIYGHGVQYNYYWNPENGEQCYPGFSQCIIHHDLDNTGPTLGINGQLVFTNRHDMMAYILTLKDPATGFRDSSGARFTINNIKETFGNDSIYDSYINHGELIKSPYILLKEEHYRTFSQFVNEIDKTRENKGINLVKLLTHVVTQVKGTINNPVSSRSILVYDFQINLDTSATNKIYIPFLIYDLPGKEDVAATYVTTNETDIIRPDVRRRLFKDIPNDPEKAIKSTYVQNPLLLPIYGDNIIIIENLLRAISSSTGLDPKYDGKKLGAKFEEDLVKEILDYKIKNFYYDLDKYPNYVDLDPSGVEYQVKTLYTNPTTFTNITELFDKNNFILEFFDNMNAFDNMTLNRGIVSTSVFTSNIDKFDDDKIAKELKILIAIIVISFLIRHQLFDLIVEMIARIVNGSDSDLDNPNDGGWSRNKIYAFFEAYYINENVVGLLQYLIKSVLGKQQTNIKPQDTINETMATSVNKNYSMANRYRVLNNLLVDDPKNIVGLNYNLKINTEYIKLGDNVLKDEEIRNFMSKYDIEPDGTFAIEETPVIDALKRMEGVISFENKGKYDNNKIFRSGEITCNKPSSERNIYNPMSALYPTDTSIPRTITEKNRPLLQDFIEPYEQKISFYYVFYVLSNSQMKNKAEEQVKLLNNSMPFVAMMDPSSKKKTCVS